MKRGFTPRCIFSAAELTWKKWGYGICPKPGSDFSGVLRGSAVIWELTWMNRGNGLLTSTWAGGAGAAAGRMSAHVSVKWADWLNSFAASGAFANTVVCSASVLDACCMQRPLKRKVCWSKTNKSSSDVSEICHSGFGGTTWVQVWRLISGGKRLLSATNVCPNLYLSVKIQERCPIGTEIQIVEGKYTFL